MTTNQANVPDDAGARCSHRCLVGPLSLIVAILIAGVLQFAAAAKVSHGADVLRRMKDAGVKVEHGLPTDFDPADYQWLREPDAGLHGGVPIEFAISAGEFLLVALVLLGYRGRVVWLVVPIVFASFFGYALQRALNGLPCGCFGDLWHPPDGVSMAFDAAFVLFAFIIGARRGTHAGLLAGAGVLSAACLGGGYLYAARTVDHGAGASQPAPVSTTAPGDSTSNPGYASASEQDAPREHAPTFDPGMSAPEKLVASSLMAEHVGNQETTGEPVAYYVFIWDPTCSTCERLKPVVEEYKSQYEDEANPFLRVLLFKKQDLREGLGIQTYEWDSSPFVFAVRDGQVVVLPGGDDAPLPDEILERLTNDEPLTDGE